MDGIKCSDCRFYTVLIKIQCGYCRKYKKDVALAHSKISCECYKSRSKDTKGC